MSPPVTDIDAVIRQWAERRVSQSSTQQRRNAAPSSLTFEIDWSKVRFSAASTNFKPQQYQRGSPRSQVVFKSNYENHTNEVQNHTFMMDRKTDATVRSKVTKGFSRNGLVGIKIQVPDHVSNQTGSFGSDINVLSEDENTVKHEIAWGLNSTVKAPAGMRTVAELKITETEHQCQFDTEVHIRGRVIVRVMNGETTWPIEGNLATIIEDEMGLGEQRSDGLVGVQGKKVIWNVSGNLSFKFGVSQDVKVWSERL